MGGGGGEVVVANEREKRVLAETLAQRLLEGVDLGAEGREKADR